MATIFDVANRAGVSIKTVSRVLNNASNVRPQTQKKVQLAMRELEYHPSFAARELRSGQSEAIGIIFSDPSGGFQGRLHSAALSACRDAGCFLTAALIEEGSDNWADQLAEFLNRTRIRRMILVPPFCDSADLREQLREEGVTFTLISPSIPAADAVSLGMNEEQAAYEVTQHLVSLGHERIGHIAGIEDHVATQLRKAGFLRALAEAGLEARENWLGVGAFNFRDARDVARQMLADPGERPTAIFAANDEMAAAVCYTASSLGLTVPDDLSVAGFDDVAIATAIWPPLTTVSQPFTAIAAEAVRRLVEPDPEADQGQNEALECRLIIRESTAPPPVG
ncbi:LacI family DNA-binding transcriptional regulator [Hyphobacterium sp. HN65]|uniref:LacI family DNA-binding transcriptional regulator n=1 Tax=Hyphobacterium lacteum TaxID=3116575 RepID=A0ABU7LSF2_9PROT|nr:LacI family DNA-binding transcriptional regulator [Hyphobacterium sp. HN65]MEE2526847.1 LacI family DNA-binding transcriptional regulator [Hyphobacterium sp. HN65]